MFDEKVFDGKTFSNVLPHTISYQMTLQRQHRVYDSYHSFRKIFMMREGIEGICDEYSKKGTCNSDQSGSNGVL